MKRSLNIERTYPYPPDAVWRALTDPAALSEWMMDNDFQPYVGHRFTFRTKAYIGFDGIVQCEVIAVDPPRRLAYTWQGGWMKQPTTVTWTLTPIPEGTLLRLDHTGFEGLAGVALSFILGSGWRSTVLPRLEAWLRRQSGQAV